MASLVAEEGVEISREERADQHTRPAHAASPLPFVDLTSYIDDAEISALDDYLKEQGIGPYFEEQVRCIAMGATLRCTLTLTRRSAHCTLHQLQTPHTTTTTTTTQTSTRKAA